MSSFLAGAAAKRALCEVWHTQPQPPGARFRRRVYQSQELETKLRLVSEHVLRFGLINSESELHRVTLVGGDVTNHGKK